MRMCGNRTYGYRTCAFYPNLHFTVDGVLVVQHLLLEGTKGYLCELYPVPLLLGYNRDVVAGKVFETCINVVRGIANHA